MKCPSCNLPSAVLETRTTKLGIRRRRRCECGHKFTTVEVQVPSDRQHDDARVVILSRAGATEIRAAARALGELLGTEVAQLPMTVAEVRDALAVGEAERKAAEKTMKRSPRR